MNNIVLRRRAIAPKEFAISGAMPLTFNARRLPIKSFIRTGLCEQKPVQYLATVTQTGKCEQAGTPTPTVPVPIKCNNGTIKVSANLSNMVSGNIAVGKYINNSGVASTDASNFYYSAFIPVTPGGTYTMKRSASLYTFSVMEYDASQGFLRRSLYGGSGGQEAGTETTFTVGNDCYFILFGSNVNRTTLTLASVLAIDWMLTESATGQDYHAYGELYVDGTAEVITDANGNTAGAANLPGVGNYADTQEIISGAITRNVGIKVLNGTENFNIFAQLAGTFSLPFFDMATGGPNLEQFFCTHLVTSDLSAPPYGVIKAGGTTTVANRTVYFRPREDITTVDDFKAWIAAQYRAGTPVVIVYPLATATTESVAGQTLVKSPLSATAEITIPNFVTTDAPVSTPDTKHQLPIWCNNGELKVNQQGQIYVSGTPEVLTLTDGQGNTRTVSVKDLLSASEYKDEQEIITGVLSKKIGVKVFNGTEPWVKSSQGSNFMFYIDEQLTDALNVSASDGVLLCNIAIHYRNSWNNTANKIVQRSNKNFGFMNPIGFSLNNAISDWTAYVAEQFAAGTPIMVLYPLVNATTEQVTPQTISAFAGENNLSSQANVGPISATVKYYR